MFGDIEVGQSIFGLLVTRTKRNKIFQGSKIFVRLRELMLEVPDHSCIKGLVIFEFFTISGLRVVGEEIRKFLAGRALTSFSETILRKKLLLKSREFLF